MTFLSVIVNADDLGLSDVVNREVERLHQAGVLSSATVMANGPFVSQVPAIQERNPELGLGLHMNASNFQALTPDVRTSKLCDENGVFHLDFRRRFSSSLTPLLVSEWMAQLRKLQEMGIRIDHFDSHHHVHTWPAVMGALREVSRQSGIRWVRNTRNVVLPEEKSGSRQRVKYAGKWCWTRWAKIQGLKTTQGFCGVMDLIKLVDAGRFPKQLKKIELMCHPGDLGNSEYVAEVKWLESELNHWLDGHGRLLRYSDLD